MCWLLVIFTALLCSQVSHARTRGSGRVVDHGTQDDHGSQIQEDPVSKIQEGTGSKIQKELDEALKEVELAERLTLVVNSRESRGLLKKVAFLAGMRVGGLVQSSGTLAASNSFRVFGKVVNSALSVSYGNIEELNEIPGFGPETSVVAKRPDPEEPVKASVKVVSVEERPVTPGIREAEEEAHRKIKANFLKGHNELVERANANSKYLRLSRAQEHGASTDTNH